MQEVDLYIDYIASDAHVESYIIHARRISDPVIVSMWFDGRYLILKGKYFLSFAVCFSALSTYFCPFTVSESIVSS